MILKVQRSVVSLCHEDANVSLDKLHRITEDGLRDGLKTLGFNMDGNVSLTTVIFLSGRNADSCEGSRDIVPSSCWPLYWFGRSRRSWSSQNREADSGRVHHH